MRISVFDNASSIEILRSCAELYCKIWREPPWNEEFWTVEDVLEDLKKQVEMPGGKGFLAVKDSKVFGFTWGYSVTKLMAREISGNYYLDPLFDNFEKIFYLAELGVCSSVRNHRIGERLTVCLIEDVKKNDIKLITLRTDVRADSARHLYQKLGFRDLQIKDAKHYNRTYWVFSLI